MARLAIIPARSGSKRIPGKNIKDFFGKPVIAYSIQAALDCGLFDEVMVSTDDLKIADIAKAHGAQVPFLRSEKNSDDQATTLDVIKEVLNYYKSNLNKSFDQICCIYPAAPLINDINRDLYIFWKYCKEDMEGLVSEVTRIKNTYANGRALFTELTDGKKDFTDFERAVRFFVLNRITFSGTIESGGYSEQSFNGRFTDSSIKRLEDIKELLSNVEITNLDYQKIINEDGKNVFIFLDPPYLSTKKSKLYGKNGDLHELFDHEQFAENMKQCKHKWLITYDNSPEVKKLFSFANIYEWELQYGMNNYKQTSASKGQELFISNYEIPILKCKKIAFEIDSSIKSLNINKIEI